MLNVFGAEDDDAAHLAADPVLARFPQDRVLAHREDRPSEIARHDVSRHPVGHRSSGRLAQAIGRANTGPSRSLLVRSALRSASHLVCYLGPAHQPRGHALAPTASGDLGDHRHIDVEAEQVGRMLCYGELRRRAGGGEEEREKRGRRSGSHAHGARRKAAIVRGLDHSADDSAVSRVGSKVRFRRLPNMRKSNNPSFRIRLFGRRVRHLRKAFGDAVEQM